MKIEQQIRNLIIEHPEKEIVFMTHYEVCQSDDYNYWLGHPSKVVITDIYNYDGRVYFDDDFEDLEETIEDNIMWKRGTTGESIELSESEIDKLVSDEIKRLIEIKEIRFQEKTICIYIHV